MRERCGPDGPTVRSSKWLEGTLIYFRPRSLSIERTTESVSSVVSESDIRSDSAFEVLHDLRCLWRLHSDIAPTTMPPRRKPEIPTSAIGGLFVRSPTTNNVRQTNVTMAAISTFGAF